MALIGTINSDVQFRNRIINGDINIDQRFGGTANTPVGASAGTYVIDRWCFQCSPASKISIQQMQVANSSASNYEASSAPAGFINSMKFTVASANTVGAGDYYNLYQAVEGVNVQDLDWGTAAAKPVTLSFWVKSSVVGTYTGSLKNADVNRSYPYTYTISSANTWEQKTVTITGDTTGTWKKDNTVGIYVGFNLGAGASFTGGTVNTWSAINTQGVTGQTSLQGASNSGATWYLTGVQLEPGSTATPFEHRPFGMELALCQRYYERFTGNANLPYKTGYSYNTYLYLFQEFKVTKRTIGGTNSSSASGSTLLSAYGTGNAESFLGNLMTGSVVFTANDLNGMTFYQTLSANTYSPYGTAILWAFKTGQWMDYSAEL